MAAENDDRMETDLPELPFVTTSDLLERLNQNLQEVAVPGYQPRFELQKRLPDGSAVPASSSDMAYSDLQTKIQQCAKFVSQLQVEDRRKWAEEHRLVGNQFFQKGKFREAMDIYLTCLVVKDDTPEFLRDTLLKVLLNLAQCTLQLGMNKKTIEFCQIALHEIGDQQVDSVLKSKIYFRLGKAFRLIGDYQQSRKSLSRCLECIAQSVDHGAKDDNQKAYMEATQKELLLVAQAELEAQKNRQRQKQALQKEWTANKTEKSDNSRAKEGSPHTKAPRQFSSLRARKPEVESKVEPEGSPELSYFQHYCLVVARVAEALLIWLGDEETTKKVKERVD